MRIQSGVEFNDSIWLTEVSENSDSFAGFAVMLNSGTPVYGDTALQALTGDGITVSYTDSANSYGDPVNLTQAAMFAGNAIGGYLPPGKTIWDIGGSPYIIAGNLTLNAGDTLEIEPGVTVKFLARPSPSDPRDSLRIYGTLIAVGTQADSIIFTSTSLTPQVNSWGCIYVNNGRADLRYCGIRYANRGLEFDYFSFGQAVVNTIRHCDFTQMYYGVTGTTSTPTW